VGSVTIGSATYQIYGTFAGAGDYWNGGLGDSKSAWDAASLVSNKQQQALVAATRLLDEQPWLGTPVGTPQLDVVLQWPRSGVSGVDSLTTPDGVIKGCYELAGALLVDSTVQSAIMSGSNVKMVKASSVTVEFFQSTFGFTGLLPPQVERLIAQYLAGAGTGVTGSESFGTDAESQFDDDDRFDVSQSIL
jgi:hypothetical protein